MKKIYSLKLVIDIGNTSTKVALFESKEILLVSVINQFSLVNIQKIVGNKEISSAIISSVKKNSSEILSVIDYYKAIILTENVALPIKNHYKTPNTLGNDRLAAVVGGYFLYPKKEIIIIDAGTCLTIDYISQNGEYIGGRISPGIEMRYKALNTFTENLPLVQKEKLAPMIGSDTKSSIISGVQKGILSEVRSIISDWKLQKSDLITLITGGDHFFFENELKSSIFAHPNLVLIGLNEILDFNE